MRIEEIFDYNKDLKKYKKLYKQKKHLINESFEDSIFFKTLNDNYKKVSDSIFYHYDIIDIKEINKAYNSKIEITFKNNTKGIFEYKLDLDNNENTSKTRRLYLTSFATSLFIINEYGFQSKYISRGCLSLFDIKTTKNLNSFLVGINKLFMLENINQSIKLPELIDKIEIHRLCSDEFFFTEELVATLKDINKTKKETKNASHRNL